MTIYESGPHEGLDKESIREDEMQRRKDEAKELLIQYLATKDKKLSNAVVEIDGTIPTDVREKIRHGEDSFELDNFELRYHGDYSGYTLVFELGEAKVNIVRFA